MREYLTRKQFDEAAAALANQHPDWALPKILAMNGGYDAFPSHLKEDLHKKLGLYPETVFFKAEGQANG